MEDPFGLVVTIVRFVLLLTVLIMIHEAGHFFSARAFGVKVLEFGWGFPPRAFGLYTGPDADSHIARRAAHGHERRGAPAAGDEGARAFELRQQRRADGCGHRGPYDVRGEAIRR